MMAMAYQEMKFLAVPLVPLVQVIFRRFYDWVSCDWTKGAKQLAQHCTCQAVNTCHIVEPFKFSRSAKIGRVSEARTLPAIGSTGAARGSCQGQSCQSSQSPETSETSDLCSGW